MTAAATGDGGGCCWCSCSTTGGFGAGPFLRRCAGAARRQAWPRCCCGLGSDDDPLAGGAGG